MINADSRCHVTKLIIVVLAFVFGISSSVLTQDQTISGVALDLSCEPIPGVTVFTNERRPVTTDMRGRFTVDAGSETLVTLHARLVGFRSVERVSELTSLTRSGSRVFLLPQQAQKFVRGAYGGDQSGSGPRRPETPRLHVRVLDEQCQPLAHAEVRVIGHANTVASTDANGRVSFDSTSSGTHVVEITAADFIRVVLQDFVVDDKNTGEFTVPMGRGTPRESVTVLPR